LNLNNVLDDPKTVPLLSELSEPQLFAVLPIMMIGLPGFLGALRFERDGLHGV
jgi:hypothetical protein